ncbi:MAG: aminotransferase class I/II-fold pyridoxal phosphate-dependent enzyme [Culicoidibacterales bacterium]
MQQQTPLLSALLAYSDDDIACFDVPGHKRGQGMPVLQQAFGEQLMRIDTNSAPKIDNVANPTGVIAQAQQLLAQAYGANEAFFLTNGTTSAIHVMMMATLKPGDLILLPRNIHKSALNALILTGAIPVYMQPNINQHTGISENITLDQVKSHHQAHPELKAIFVLNPTYYGFVSELAEIVSYCHEQNLIVLIDEAHGSHFHFHSELPNSAMQAGADMSSISLHKTGGALTQASALLVNTNRIDAATVQQTINLLQTTSSSYLLMASLDAARHNLAVNGNEQLTQTLKHVAYAREQIGNIPGLSCVQAHSQQMSDATKLGIHVRGLGLSGFQVYEYFWQHEKIQLEMADLDNVLAIFSLGETAEHVQRLIDAFKRLAKRSQITNSTQIFIGPPQVEVVYTPRQAYYARKIAVPLAEAAMRLCGESILAYPPGIPIIAPGERITAEIIRYIQALQAQQAYLTDHHDPSLATILVIEE